MDAPEYVYWLSSHASYYQCGKTPRNGRISLSATVRSMLLLRARRDFGNASKILQSNVFDAFPKSRRALYRVVKQCKIPAGIPRGKHLNVVSSWTRSGIVSIH
jgi:hypothetical protein